MTEGIQIVIAILKAASPVTAIVGVRNYPIDLPERAAPPCNIINRIGRRDEQMLSGAGKYYSERIRVESIATESDAALSLAQAVNAALEDVVKQDVGGGTDVDVRFADNDYTDRDDMRTTYRVVQDFFVRYRT